MKAIMINSDIEKVYYCELSNNADQRTAEIYDRLNCRIFTVAKVFDDGSALFVDDEGLLTLNNESKFFQVNDSQILAGNGIIIGPEKEDETGEDYIIEDTGIKIEELEIIFFDQFYVPV